MSTCTEDDEFDQDRIETVFYGQEPRLVHCISIFKGKKPNTDGVRHSNTPKKGKPLDGLRRDWRSNSIVHHRVVFYRTGSMEAAPRCWQRGENTSPWSGQCDE